MSSKEFPDESSFLKEARKAAEIMAAYQQQISEQVELITKLNYSIRIPDIYRNLPKVDNSTFIQSITVAEKIIKTIQPIYQYIDTDAIKNKIASLTEGIDELSRRMASDLASMQIARDNIISTKLLDNISKVMQVKRDEVDAFSSAGWPIAPSMPVELRRRVVKLHQQGKTRYISQAIMGHYRSNNHAHLIQMVNSWQNNPLLASRYHIFKDALDAHIDGKFTLSVPALVPQIEGVLTDYVKKNNLVAKYGKIKEIYTAAIGDVNGYGLAEWAIVQTLMHLLKTSTYVYTNFEEELTKSERSRKTTRHTVLHGIDINYHKPSNSLKLFLLLDAISVLEQ